MPTSAAEQEFVQARIDEATEEARISMKIDAEATLAEINFLANQKFLSREERKAADIAVEVLTRLEATERGKGWWYRAKRRVQIIQIYLGR